MRSAPVLEKDGTLAGLLSTSNIIEGFMNDWDANVLKEAMTPIVNVIDTLEAEVLYLNEEMSYVEGAIHVASMRKGRSAQENQRQGYCHQLVVTVTRL